MYAGKGWFSCLPSCSQGKPASTLVSELQNLFGAHPVAADARCKDTSNMPRWCCATQVTTATLSPKSPTCVGCTPHCTRQEPKAAGHARTREEPLFLSRRSALQSAVALTVSAGLAWPQVSSLHFEPRGHYPQQSFMRLFNLCAVRSELLFPTKFGLQPPSAARAGGFPSQGFRSALCCAAPAVNL